MSTTLLDTLLDRDADDPILTWVDDHGRDGPTRTTGELLRHAGAVARALRKAGVESGAVVALVHPPGVRFLDAFVGCLLVGAVPAPVYPPDPLRDDDRGALLAHLAHCGVSVALTERRYDRMRRLGALRRPFTRAPRIQRWIAVDGLRPVALNRAGIARSTPDTVALLQFTSGSTGHPKGVELTHGNLVHQLEMNREVLGLGPATRAVGWVPQYHDLGLISVMLSAVVGNGRAWMMSPLTFLRRPGLWMEVMHRVRATATAAPDFGYALAVRKTAPAQRATWDLSSLTVAMSAGEPVRPATRGAFIDAFAISGFDPAAFCPAYGLAEHTVGATVWGGAPRRFAVSALQHGRLLERDDGAALMPSGRPAPGVEVAIVERPDGGAPARLPDGRVGEIWLRSASVARGYRGQPDDPHFGALLPAAGPGGWLCTGDLGALHDGELYVTGRAKDLIIVGGRNVHPEDVEETVRRAHPHVRPGGVAVVGLPAVETEAVAVAVELRQAAEISNAGDVVDAIARAVAGAHRLGGVRIALLPAGALPKTTSGKLRRGEIRRRWMAGSLTRRAVQVSTSAARAVADGWRSGSLTAAVDSGDAAVTLVAIRTLLAHSLDCPPDAIDPDVPLLDQGFDSLRMAELLGVIEAEVPEARGLADALTPAALAARLLAPSLAEAPTLPAMAAVTARAGSIPPPHAEPPAEGYRLTPSQTQYLGFHRLAPDEPLVTFAALLWIDGPVCATALADAAGAVLARTADLRMTLRSTADGPRVFIGDPGPVTVVDLSAEADPAEVVRQRAREAAAQSWAPLWDTPPIAVTVFALGDGRHAVCLRCNHIFFDGPSLDRLMPRFVMALDDPAGLPLWGPTQARHLTDDAGDAAAEAEAFWTTLLADVAPDVEAPPVALRRARFRSLPLPEALVARITEGVARRPLGAATLHLAAMAAVEAARLDRDDVLLRAPLNLAPGSDRTSVGCHVLIAPLPLGLDAEAPVEQLLTRTEQTLARAVRYARVDPGIIARSAPGPLPLGPSVNTWRLTSAVEGPVRLTVEQVHSGRQADLLESALVFDGTRVEALYRYSVDHHDDAAIERMHRALVQALGALVHTPALTQGDLQRRLKATLAPPRPVEPATVPDLDLGRWQVGDAAARGRFADALFEGLSTHGFVTLRGHGIDPVTIDGAYAMAERLFALPETSKRACAGALRGYTPPGTEHAVDHPVADLKAFWQVGHADAADRWPADLPAARGTFTAVFEALFEVGRALMAALATRLGVDEAFFDAHLRRGASLLRVVHYPPLGADCPPGAVRAAAHEDISLLTLMPASRGPGLQILDRAGRWRTLEAGPDRLIVDCGDMLQRWTRGRLTATTHRVVNPTDRQTARYALPFFLQPRPDTVLDGLPACADRPGPPPITAGALLAERLRAIGLPTD